MQVHRVGVAVRERECADVGHQIERSVHHPDRGGGRIVEAVARGATRQDGLLEVVNLAAAAVAVVVLQAAVGLNDVGVRRAEALRVERREVQVAGLRCARAKGVAHVVEGPGVQGVLRDGATAPVGHHDVRIRRRVERRKRNRDVLVRADAVARRSHADVAACTGKAQLHVRALQVRLQSQVGARGVVRQQTGPAHADRVDRAEQRRHRGVHAVNAGQGVGIATTACRKADKHGSDVEVAKGLLGFVHHRYSWNGRRAAGQRAPAFCRFPAFRQPVSVSICHG